MNSKKINRINAITSLVLVVTYLLLALFMNIIGYSTFSNGSRGASFFKDGIVDLFVNNDKAIVIIMSALIILFSIISAIQNKDNKKMIFWNIVLCVSNIMLWLSDWDFIILAGIVPILIAILNIFSIKKNKPKMIQLISYIVVILLSIPVLLDIWYSKYIGLIWCFISAIMLIIYTHIQENKEESKLRKRVNIIMYFIIKPIITIGIFLIVVYCIVAGKINNDKLKNETIEIANKISELSTKSNEKLIPAQRDSKYGFVNVKGEEVIKAEYDIVSSFYTYIINGKECCFAYAKKDNDFFIILENKKIINLQENNSDYLKNTYEIWPSCINSDVTRDLKETVFGATGTLYLNTSGKISDVEEDDDLQKNTLEPDNSEFDDDDNWFYEYNLKNGIQVIITEVVDDDDDNYDNDNYKYNITTKKDNKIIQNDKNVTISNDYSGSIYIYSNGSIPFCNLEKNVQGWYDATTGKKTTIQGKIQILDVANNGNVIIRDYSTSERIEKLLDGKTGNTIVQGKVVEKVEKGYIITDNNEKMYLIDEDGNVKSKQYDLIIDVSTKDNVLFMCANKKTDKYDCKLMDSTGNILTKQSYSKFGFDAYWDYYYLKHFIDYGHERTSEGYFDDEYEKYYSDK